MRSLVTWCLITSALVAAGCSGEETVSSTPSVSGPASASSTTPSTTVASTVPPTTATPSTVSPPTTVAATTVPDTSAVPTTASMVPSSTEPPVTVPTPPTAYAIVGSSLVEVDVATGDVARTVYEPFVGDGIFRTGLRVTPDRSTAYFSEAYEDGWYACETSVGTIGRVDLATGEVTILGGGTAVQIDDDASHTVHLMTEVCEPDPEAPDIWVLTPYDRVVVTDLASGETTTYTTDTPPTDDASPSAVRWADLAPDGSLLVATVAGDVHRIPSGATGAIQTFPSVATLDDETSPVEVLDDSTLLAAVLGAEGSTDLITVDLTDGTRRPYAATETAMAIGVSSDGAIVLASDTEVATANDVPVTVLDVAGDDTVHDLDW